MSLGSHRLCKPSLLVLLTSFLGVTAFVLVFACGWSATPAWAQDKTDDKTPDKVDDKADTKTDKTDKTEKKDDEEPPAPEEIELTTGDRVLLHITYFPGTKGQESIPVILIHGFNKGKGSQKDFNQGLAPYLQKELGCAVVVPDLRGYGESIKLKRNGEQTEEIDSKKKKAEDLKDKRRMEDLKKKLQGEVEQMVTEDLRAVKDFLWKKNNAKALNLDKLVVVGVEEGASLALGYAAYDAVGYEEGEAKVGPLKLGKFVKALVLISPVTKFRGSPALKALAMPEVRADLPVMIVVGNKTSSYLADAEKISNLFEKSRPPEKKLAVKSKTVFFFANIETGLQGCKLLDEPSLNIPAKIVHFLKLRLVENPVAKEKWIWKELKHPHE